MDNGRFTTYADAVTDFVARAPLLEEWPECRQLLLTRLSAEPAWGLALPALSCVAVGGNGDDAIPITAAWVTLYLAADVLDSVQDGDDIGALGFDNPATAISSAMGMVFAAYRFLTSVQARQGTASRIAALFSEAGFHSSLGQHLCLVREYEDMPLDEALEAYWRAAILKSGSIFRVATAGGAAAGTDSEPLIATMGEFGTCLGVILQVLDDCRDVLARSGIANCEVSLPLLLLSMAPQNGRGQAHGPYIPEPGTPLSREALFDILGEADVPGIITDVLLEWRRRALDSLAPLKQSEAVAALEGIVQQVLTAPASD